jgi:Uncharacterized conserved protein (DUF2190)
MAAPNLKGGIVEYFSPGDNLTMTVGTGGVVGGNVVSLSANRTVVKAGANDIPLGVALHDAAAGEIVTVAVEGVWPCKASGAIGFGDIVGTGAAGTVATVAAAGGTYAQAEANEGRTIVGIALESIADTAVGRVKLRL